MTTLVVTAHPAPGSVSAQWAATTAEGARQAGETVLTSDLGAMGFDPAESGAHYGIEGPFDVLRTQEKATAHGRLPGDVAGEIGKIRAADRIVFHFPMWWFGPPALLKGWLDRCLANGALHDGDRRFDNGLCRGKSALFCVTTGSTAAQSGPGGKEGDARLLLWPLAYALRYCGFDVLQPRLLHGVHGYHTGAARDRMADRIRAALSAQPALLAEWDAQPRIPFNADTDFDDDGRLRHGAPQHSPFIQQQRKDPDA